MNKLSQEISPYLLQHAENPVDWQPWGPEALERARAEQKPIFLSIGYSACHWCHVMAHESFENHGIAELLNRDFICIKVDREERPDLDQIYMDAVQAMTGQGGWPMSVFLTPEQKPFFGGTYWPLNGRGGMLGFGQVVSAVATAWRDRRTEVFQQAEKAVQFLQAQRVVGSKSADLNEAPLETAEAALAQAFDDRLGGFGSAPKFPHATDLKLLLARWRATRREQLLKMVVVTLDRMAAGGIYDHLGGGFHRYSVDAEWLVPHFEKMLYDNAMLANCYLDAWQETERHDYLRVVRETLDYVLRDMTDPLGGFYSAEDADSEGEEGKFYIWTPQEVEKSLGPERAAAFCYAYDVTATGNFEGRNILHLSKPIAVCAKILGRDAASLEEDLAADRIKLLDARTCRVRPGRDDKVLVSWNGLMIDAMARAGAVLNEPRYRTAAAAAADFLLAQVRDDHGRLLHCWRAGQARHKAFLDDHASLCNALVTLHETQSNPRWLDEATRLADAMLARFADPEAGGFFYTSSDHEPLIARKKDLWDTPVPSSTGLAATALLRLARHTGRDDYRRTVEETLRVSIGWMERASLGVGQLLFALDAWLATRKESVVEQG
ncbi:MAG: thioredoxin domain-containing protein [Thermoguttaceae bacterium]